ncbi:DUF4202 domain-containing protein [Paracoccus jiaweipingae]|uniref:DUF4202 domain-containing protein n=1 Tax=unclassified Paracoccus (in: a-proteobacteria) TaxID=2688777 RepID=UPI0037AF4447
MTRRQAVFAAIDAANSQDPRHHDGVAVELLYGQRMTAEQQALHPDAPDALAIACRGQHIERWTLPRHDFPKGRAGYLHWRRAQAQRHAQRVMGLMRDAGYDAETVEHAGRMLRKEGIKSDPLVQALEDVACFTFMRHYMSGFAPSQSPDKLHRIVAKTARKMSAPARQIALTQFSLPPELAACFRDAVTGD